MRTTIRKFLTHKGRMYELFYWASRFTDFIPQHYKIKEWIDDKEYSYWRKWVTK